LQYIGRRLGGYGVSGGIDVIGIEGIAEEGERERRVRKKIPGRPAEIAAADETGVVAWRVRRVGRSRCVT
jgi:hypothetical protein